MISKLKTILSTKILCLTFIIISTFQIKGPALASAEDRQIKKEPLSESSRKWLEEIVPYIITSAEREIFLNLPNEEERGKFIENFWKKRDPNPQTPENEFKIAYYRRIAFANKFFSYGGIPGWKTDRGRVFILLGPPNEIQSDYFYGRDSIARPGAIREIWIYWNLPNPNLPYTLEFTFVDLYGSGDFKLETSLGYQDNSSFPFSLQASHLIFDRMEIMAEALRNPFEKAEKLRSIITSQVNYNLVPLNCDLFSRKGAEGKTQAIALLGIPLSSLEPKFTDDKDNYSITLVVNVSNLLGEKLLEKTQDLNFQIQREKKSPKKRSKYLIPLVLNLPPGKYGLHFFVLDNFSGKIGVLHHDFIFPDYKTETLAMSDLLLFSASSEIEAKSAKWKSFSAEFKQGEEMTLEFEIYNVTLNKETGQAHLLLKLLFFKENNLVTSSPPLEHFLAGTTEGQIRTSFRLNNFQPGSYRLRVEVEDKVAIRSCFKEREIKINDY